MARYARIADGRVAEIVELDGVEPAQALHPDIAATIVPAGPQVAEGWTYVGGQFAPPEPPPPPTKGELIAYAADVRWRAETGGIEVGGQTIDTSRESQNMIAGADALAQADPEEPVDYKAASGWVTLDGATVHAVALAVGRHVRSCFRKEREVVAAIEAGAIASTAEIDAAFT
jgi:hypothetical protein